MENELRKALLTTAQAYAGAAECGITTVSRRVKNNAGFFKGIEDPKKSFTARTYDEVMEWFAGNWPAGKPLPLSVMRWAAETGYEITVLSA